MKAATALALLLAVNAGAQWIKVTLPNTPRTADGKADLTAPTPKLASGKPDISGIWQPAGRYVENIASDLKPEDIPYQPWAKALFDSRRATLSKDDPTGWCVPGGVPRSDAVPYPFKIINSPGMTMVLYEAVHSFRQIFTDGRELPKDPNPTWMGYSIGKWEGDDFVVTTSGFNDHGWLDNNGKPNTEALKVTERLRRKNFGNMDIVITIDDPKAYTKPWTVTLPLTLRPDTELLEYVCAENNKDLEHLVGK